MLQTVIFDMDGVIVDTEPVHHYAYFEHFKELNIEVSAEMFATFTGNSTKNVFQKIKDKKALAVIYLFISKFGIKIGNLLSQLFANIYGHIYDRFIKTNTCDKS